MKRLARAWDRFWFAPLDALPAALFRLSVGGLLFLHYLVALPSWERFYAADGMLSLGDPAVRPAPQGWWSALWWTEGLLPVRTYWWLGALAAAAFTLGWHTRLATVVLFVVQASLVHRSPVAVNGEDLIFRMLLFYACFAALGTRLSLDARRRAAPARGREPARWPIRLMQVNLALVYLISQPYKIALDPAWVSGDAMYYVMVNRTWSRFPWPQLFYGAWVAGLATWGSLAIELALPLGVWFRALRPWVVLAAALLHVAIAVVLQNVTFFSLAMTCSFWVFLTSEDLHRFAPAARRRRAGGPAAEAAAAPREAGAG